MGFGEEEKKKKNQVLKYSKQNNTSVRLGRFMSSDSSVVALNLMQPEDI